MPTTKTRINITLPKAVEIVLNKIAKRDDMPVATKAQELLQYAIEIEEDQMWNKIASDRDKKNAKFIAHNQAWV
ncbi:MAG: hypothetical protein Q8O88_05995 [bacterium]|nr:hypothetical protein [bacterium]